MGCQIILESENASGNFFPGGTVRGKVICDFKNSHQIRGINVKLRGKEHTAWSKSRSHYNSSTKKRTRQTVHYRGNRKFIQVQVNIANAGTVGPGRFEYPFQFVLPIPCPGSFKTPHGKIWYYVKTTVDIPWGADYESTVDFNVVAPIDFNTMPGIIMNPTRYQTEKMLSCCCWSSGPITMDLNLEKEAFVLGETMKLKIYVVNMSNQTLRDLDIKLILHIKETTTSPRHDTKLSTNVISKLRDTGVGAHGNRNYDLQMMIPSYMVLPNFNGCSLFQSWCTLEVDAEVPGCHSNLKIITRIAIGHVPLITGAGMTRPIYVDGATYPVDQSAYTPNATALPYPSGNMPAVHTSISMTMPQQSAYYPSGSNASSNQEAPSAPSKTPLAEEDDFEVVKERYEPTQPSGHQLPPPSYSETVDSKKY